MPELPEVESAVRRLRAAAAGKAIARVELLHPSIRRRVSPARLRSLRGARVRDVERRGKHQLLHLEDGRVIHAHFRMTGDWTVDHADDGLPRFARATITFDDGTRVVLDDPRALSTLDLHPAGADLSLGLGPEPGDPALTVDYLARALAKRRGPVKPALLDQRLIAGLGNIYAAESLWHARISPLAPAASLTKKQIASLLTAIQGDRTRDRCALHGRVGVAAGRVRSRRQAMPAVPYHHRAHGTGGKVHVLLSALPALIHRFQ